MESAKFKFFVKSCVHHPSESLSGWLENELSSLSFAKKYFEFIFAASAHCSCFACNFFSRSDDHILAFIFVHLSVSVLISSLNYYDGKQKKRAKIQKLHFDPLCSFPNWIRRNFAVRISFIAWKIRCVFFYHFKIQSTKLHEKYSLIIWNVAICCSRKE